MQQDEIRRAIIVALVSDDQLMDQLVLKGGNALSLVHGIGDRTSLDLDYSLGDDFHDLTATSARILTCLETEFGRRGFVVFDFECNPKPKTPRDDTPHWWGGYLVTFKLLDRPSYNAAKNLEDARRRAVETSSGAGAKRTFKLDISKYEYVAPKTSIEIDDYIVYVYTPEMIAAEKLRAICQQMSGYSLTSDSMKHARPRDFYDIHSIVTHTSIDLASPENTRLIEDVFKAKGVPLQFLGMIGAAATFDFHEAAWPSVRASAKPDRDFRYYFDFVRDTVERLEALWKVNPPV